MKNLFSSVAIFASLIFLLVSCSESSLMDEKVESTTNTSVEILDESVSNLVDGDVFRDDCEAHFGRTLKRTFFNTGLKEACNTMYDWADGRCNNVGINVVKCTGPAEYPVCVISECNCEELGFQILECTISFKVCCVADY